MIATGADTNVDPGGWLSRIRWIVRSPNPLGDACMSLPAVRALKRANPAIRLTVACRENIAPLWESCESVESVVPFSKGLSPLAVGRLIRTAGSFDAGLLFPNSFRSALELRLGGVRRLAGYAGHQRGFLLKLAVPERREEMDSRHDVHRYLDLVYAFGVRPASLEETLALPPAPTPVPAEPAEIHLGLCPGAEFGNAKRYPVERYARAVTLLRERYPGIRFRVSIFGSPAERGIGEELAGLLAEPRVNRAGETTIAGLVEELRSCHFLATNDTGTMHLAAALGVPTVAIFGSTEPALTAPVGTVHRVIREKVDCSPCFLRECPVDYRCMLRIEPERVTDEMEALLASNRSRRDTNS
ncbi:MAG: lipopolysaccharide heptosyltransferase II [Verrucomicrobiae bacterium]|nr:lipopolysaccharide heptosyltransferase II [Verrucomicrobiae bacterium]